MKQVDRFVVYLKDSDRYSDVFEDDVKNGISISFEVRDSILYVKKEVELDDGDCIEGDNFCYPMDKVNSFNFKEYCGAEDKEASVDELAKVDQVNTRARVIPFLFVTFIVLLFFVALFTTSIAFAGIGSS